MVIKSFVYIYIYNKIGFKEWIMNVLSAINFYDFIYWNWSCSMSMKWICCRNAILNQIVLFHFLLPFIITTIVIIRPLFLSILYHSNLLCVWCKIFLIFRTTNFIITLLLSCCHQCWLQSFHLHTQSLRKYVILMDHTGRSLIYF